jgi:hypothetical protein
MIMFQAARRRSLLTLCLLCLVSVVHCPAVRAGHPQYWILGRQQSGTATHVHPQGYAYGWFGASPRQQAARQTGYYGSYRQWTFR